MIEKSMIDDLPPNSIELVAEIVDKIYGYLLPYYPFIEELKNQKFYCETHWCPIYCNHRESHEDYTVELNFEEALDRYIRDVPGRESESSGCRCFITRRRLLLVNDIYYKKLAYSLEPLPPELEWEYYI